MTRGTIKPERALGLLARLHGVQTRYIGMDGKVKIAAPETLLRVLATLGAFGGEAPRTDTAGLIAAIERRRLEPWRRRVQPVHVAWDGRAGTIEYCLAPGRPARPIEWQLELEEGGTAHGAFAPEQLELTREIAIGGQPYSAVALKLPRDLPPGYHRLRLREGDFTAETLLIAAPTRAWAPPEETGGRGRPWGVFMPLYALHADRSWGAGDLTDFAHMTRWVADRGGQVVATLPLLAAFLEEPCEPSPYVPASRLFWNEFYTDLTIVPELEYCPAARELMESAAFAEEVAALRAAPMVDYPRQMALKIKVLEALARAFADGATAQRREDFERWRAGDPAAEDYAAFRATCRRHHGSFYVWPEERQRAGELRPGDFDPADQHYYLYTQWVVQRQMEALADFARGCGPGLYLDLPLGVHPDSYDVWRERDCFAGGISGGAPPDAFFAKGQCWGFPPLHPERLRERHYDYLRRCLSRLMRHAGIMRIDHVMGLHRLFWVPNGMEATEGVYVHYPAEELYAILSLESHRNRSRIVGEDLGTVPDYGRAALDRHGLLGMYVAQFMVHPDPNYALTPPKPGQVASLNTHDMTPWAGFWQGRDIDDQLDLGLIKSAEEWGARQRRAQTREALRRYFERRGGLPPIATEDPAMIYTIHDALIEMLAAGPSPVLLINMEDLWQETRQQNTPGTVTERPNWRQRSRFSLDQFAKFPELERLFDRISALRRQPPRPIEPR